MARVKRVSQRQFAKKQSTLYSADPPNAEPASASESSDGDVDADFDYYKVGPYNGVITFIGRVITPVTNL